MKLLYTDRAKDDVELAFEWYERQRPWGDKNEISGT
jgi:plasmid stabilization system protein ParE